MALAPKPNTNGQGTEDAGEEAPAATRPGLALLAAKNFGDQFKGDVPAETPKAEDVEGGGTAVEDPPEENPEGEPEGDTPPEDTPEETGEEADPGEAGETQEGEEEGEPISSLDELAAHQNWDREWLEGLKVPVKVNGKSSVAPIKELIANYQITEAAEERLSKAKEQAQSLQQEMAGQQEQLQNQFAIAAKIIQKAEDQVDTDVAAIDWNELRETDPAEFSARKLDIEERRKRIDLIKADAVSELEESAKAAQQGNAQSQRQYIEGEYKALLGAIPEWKDEKVFETETGRIREYLINQGFPQEMVVNTSDHRMILQARKAMLFDELQAKKPAAKKKLRAVPKTLRPGAPKPKQAISREKTQQARQKLRQTGSVDAAMDVIRSRREGQT